MNNWQRLLTDTNLQKNLKRRETIIAAMRAFFASRKYREIDVPLLAPALPAESYIEVFETTLLNRHRERQPAYLTTSPELYLKKLLVGGIGDCFAITKSFRNTEDLSATHIPEFTLLEWYKVGADYRGLMEETEDLILNIFYSLHGNVPPVLKYHGQLIDLKKPWERLSVIEAFDRYANLNLTQLLELGPLVHTAKNLGYKVQSDTTWEELYHQIYLNEVEPKLGRGRPTILYDFPSSTAALAKKKTDDPRFAERFEVFIGGLELGDCYSELTDWQEQEERFKKETTERRRLGKIDYPYDEDFINALKTGLPKCAGLALGVDRMVMLFCDVEKIDDVIYFSAKELWTK